MFHVNNVSHVVYDVVIDNTTKTFPLQYLFVANVNVLFHFCFCTFLKLIWMHVFFSTLVEIFILS